MGARSGGQAFGGWVLATAVLLLVLAAPARARGLDDPADQWLPRSDDAQWVWSWSNDQYQPKPLIERYELQTRRGTLFRIHWGQVNAAADEQPSEGTMDFRQTDAGLVNVNYQSTPPPPEFPVLCASASQCANSVAGPLYLLIWGTRSPVIAEPLLRGTRWNATGGAADDVGSTNRYVGRRVVTVPAFPRGVLASEVESEVTQAGALGDPFGSGVRTVDWVRGVGPVRIVFRHSGGATSIAELQATTLNPVVAPSDVNLLPLNRGDSAVFRWRNNRHLKRWSRQQFDVSQVVNNTSRVDVKSLSGPLRVSGGYTFATRLSGVTQLQSFVRAATRETFPKLGPRSQPIDGRRHFFTPYDLMTFGFGPVVPIDPVKGQTWHSSRSSSDFKVFDVTGRSVVVSTATTVRTPAGKFRATLVRSVLTQKGYPFGSGTRYSWFAPDKGLVKLVFHHRDGSVSTVQRVR